ncbi:MAG: PEP-CTERM sorting domain-containing protein [Chthoniobacterales bacterium]|nr:PEP-CTERM sorting domain-containing protein [Chthoniobacterales bacterium]
MIQPQAVLPKPTLRLFGLGLALALGGIVAPRAAAQTPNPSISYVRTLEFSPYGYIFDTSFAPVVSTDPINASPSINWILDSDNGLWNYTATRDPDLFTRLPADFKLSSSLEFNHVTTIRQGTENREQLLIWSATLNLLYRYFTDTQEFNGVFVPVGHIVGTSVRYSSTEANPVMLIFTQIFPSEGSYLVDINTGDITPAFGFGGTGSAPGQFSDMKYTSFGPDGLLYALDFGNNRVQSLDPDNAFAPVAQFTLEASSNLVNMQFAIGPTGTMYLGDGLGGFSAYDSSTGEYLGATTTPEPVTPDAFPMGISPYINADPQGNIFVFDETGIHQYFDASVVPEPSTVVLTGLALLALGGRAVSKRRSRQ